MPRKPKRPCRMTGCPNLTDNKSGYCEKHEKLMQRHYERFTRGYWQHERYGSAWRRIRDRHLAREPLCEMCRERGRFVAATLVHHIKPLGDGGTHDDENLMSLCVSCHEKIHRRSRGDGSPPGGGEISKTAPLLDRRWVTRKKRTVQTGY